MTGMRTAEDSEWRGERSGLPTHTMKSHQGASIRQATGFRQKCRPSFGAERVQCCIFQI
jgi:hypothetical protein